MNLVEQTMQILDIKTVRHFSTICKVSEKTLTGWKKKITPIGEAFLKLLIENHDLKKEVEKSKAFKKSLKEYIED